MRAVFHCNADGFTVPPAELEALLLQHPDVADVAVVGVESKEEATELPRCAQYPSPFCFGALIFNNYVDLGYRAYIVPARPIATHETATFALQVQAWVADRVAAHKKLRGGVLLVEQIPKR